jgi:hypothetical protein
MQSSAAIRIFFHVQNCSRSLRFEFHGLTDTPKRMESVHGYIKRSSDSVRPRNISAANRPSTKNLTATQQLLSWSFIALLHANVRGSSLTGGWTSSTAGTSVGVVASEEDECCRERQFVDCKNVTGRKWLEVRSAFGRGQTN